MKITSQILTCLVTSGLLLHVAPLQAVTLTVAPATNGNIRSPNAGKFGDQNFIVGDTGAVGTNRYLNGLIAFDLNLPELSGATVNSVSITFTSLGDTSTNSSTPVTFALYLSLREFTSAATWTNFASGQAWETGGGLGAGDRGTLLSSITINTADYAGVDNLGKALTLSTNSIFVDEVTEKLGGKLYLWFGMQAGDGVDGARHVFNLASMSHETSAYRPMLTIDYSPVPEPSTAALAALSVLSLSCAMRRRRQRP